MERFWDYEFEEEDWENEGKEEEDWRARSEEGWGWGELSFAFGVGSEEYEMMREGWSGDGDCEWTTGLEGESKHDDDGWDLISNGFSDWEEVDDN